MTMGGTLRTKGGTTLATQQVPEASGGTFTDTGGVCNGVATLDAHGYAVFTRENPANTSPNPGAGAFWSWPIRDLLSAESELDLDDLFCAWLSQTDNTPPADVVVWLSVTLGDPSPTSPGIAWGLQYNASGFNAAVATNTGAGWTITAAGARNVKTTTAICRVVQGTDDGQARVSCQAADAAFESNRTTSTPIINSGAASGSDLDTIAVGFGWMTGAGGAGGTTRIRADYELRKREQTFARHRYLIGALTPPTAPVEIALMGQSNALDGGSGVDATYSGAAIPGTAAWRRNGADVTTNYRTAGDPVGIVPYLHLEVPNSRVVQQAGSGENVITQIETELLDLVADYAALGAEPDVLVYLQGEEETTNPAASPAALYLENLDHLVRLVWGYWPDCYIVLPYLLMRYDDYGGVGNSASWPIVLAAQRTICARYSSRVLGIDPLDPSPPAMADTVHYEPSAAGFGVLASRIAARMGW